MTKYGLRNKSNGKIIGYRSEENGDDADGIAVSTYLSDLSDTMWLVDDPIQAELARLNATEWYNASYDTPGHRFSCKIDQLEVVTIEIIVKTEPVEIKMPSLEEYYADNPYILEQLKKGEEIDWYTWTEYSFRKQWPS